jgi:hypothetical protein
MRKLFLASTALMAVAWAAVAQTITPGNGTLTDAAGNVWLITANGSIQENGQWTPGGGGTAALTIANGTVYGEDATGKGWFALSGSGQYWISSPTPPGQAAIPAAATASPGTQPAVPAGTTAAAATTAQTPCPSSSSAGGTGAFHVSGGQIIGPDGAPFIARGINVLEGQQPSLSQLQSAFPGTNFVRFAIYDYPSPSAISSFVNQLTAAGIVVELEDHNNNAGNAGGGQGVIFAGAALTTELAWYSAVAAAFKANPYVWFGTDNEPSEIPSAAALSTWQQQTYNAIRSAGNTSPIMVEMNCDTSGCGAGYTPSAYAGMTNIIWDMHYYNWLSGYSSDQTAISNLISRNGQSSQRITSADGTVPVLIGEYGNSTSGTSIDPGAVEAVAAVISSGTAGQYGSAAWMWDTGGPGDGLINPDGTPSSPYGQQVELYINTSVVSPSACQEAQQAAQVLAQVNQGVPATATLATAAAPTGADQTATPAQAAAPAAAGATATAASIAATNAAAIAAATQQAQNETAAQQAAAAQAVSDGQAQIRQLEQATAPVSAQIQALQAQIASGQAPTADVLTVQPAILQPQQQDQQQ